MEFAKKYGFICIDKKYYKAEHNKEQQPVLKLVSKKEVTTKIKKAKEMVKKLKDKLDREAVLMESVMKLYPEEFDTLYKMLFKGKKNYKPKTRKHHCVDMKIGKFILPIVD